MTIQIKHKFISPKSDGTDPTLIQPSNWNDTLSFKMASARLVGRWDAGVGDAQEIQVGAGLTLTGGVLKTGGAGSFDSVELFNGTIDFKDLESDNYDVRLELSGDNTVNLKSANSGAAFAVTADTGPAILSARSVVGGERAEVRMRTSVRDLYHRMTNSLYELWDSTAGAVRWAVTTTLMEIYLNLYVYGNIKAKNPDGSAYLDLEANPANFAAIRTYSVVSGTPRTRWRFGHNSDTESGADQGSDFVIQAYNDAGTLIGTRMILDRSTGDVTFAGNIVGGSGAVLTSGDSFFTSAPDANKGVKRDASGNAEFANLYLGKNGGGSTFLYFYDDTANTYRQIYWSDANSEFRLIDSGGNIRTILHDGNLNTFVAAMSSTNTGAFGFMLHNSGAAAVRGDTKPGSELRWAYASSGGGGSQASTPSGTWMCLGTSPAVGAMTLWKRVA